MKEKMEEDGICNQVEIVSICNCIYIEEITI